MPLKYPQIYEILRNEKYTGLYAYSPVQAKNRADRRAKPDSIKIENALPVIISKAQSMEVQKIMNAKKRIDEKKRQYDTLMKNIAAGVLPGEVLVDIGQQMKELKAEIAALEQTEPPKDFTVDTIRSWLESIKAAPNRDAVRLLIERIDITPEQEKEKTDFNIQSTLKSVLGKHGCGRRI
ncbi:MAG: recombinase family protein [Clostridium sp.]